MGLKLANFQPVGLIKLPHCSIIGPDSGVLPSSQPGEKEASKVYLSTKEIDAILRLMVEDRINHLNERNDLKGGKDDRNNSENKCSG